MADSISSDSSSTGFGELLSGNTNPPTSSPSTPSSDLSNVSNSSDLPVSLSGTPQPTTDNPFTSPKPVVSDEGGQPSFSFGDLIKDIKLEESVIPPPVIPSPPSPQNPQPISPQSPALPISPTFPPLVVNRAKANQARVQKRNNHLNKIMELVRTKGKITNKDIRDALRVSQSTATNYLSELVHRGSLKKELYAKATFYTI